MCQNFWDTKFFFFFVGSGFLWDRHFTRVQYSGITSRVTEGYQVEYLDRLGELEIADTNQLKAYLT